MATATAALQALGLQVAGPYGPPGSTTVVSTDPAAGASVPAGHHGQRLHRVSGPVPGCELCEAARITEWFHEDDICWVADCEVCDVPMVVWKQHGNEPPKSRGRAHAGPARPSGRPRLGDGVWSYDRVMRQIPDHFHAHARDPNWWFRRFGRR